MAPPLDDKIDYNELLNNALEYINGNADRFFTLFFLNLKENSTEIQVLFASTTPKKHAHVLHSAVMHLVNFSLSKCSNAFLFELARVHKETHRVNPQHYDIFMQVFLDTLRQVYPRYSPDCAMAWRICFAPGLTFMQHAA